MLSFSELKRGSRIIIQGDPYEIIESSHMVKGRGKSVLQAKIKNLKNGGVTSKTFRPSDNFKEAELVKIKIKFLYCNKKEEYFFCRENDPKKRLSLKKEQIGEGIDFLKENQIAEGVVFQDQIINISLPVKVSLKVSEALPGIKGDRAQAGNKFVKLENGTEIAVPLFIKQGDFIEINTEKKEYVRRI